MREDFNLNEEEVSDTEPTEQLRSLEDPVSSEEERLEASLEPEIRQGEAVKSIDWSEEMERLEENEEISDMQESPEGVREDEMETKLHDDEEEEVVSHLDKKELLMVMVKTCDDWDKEEMGFISKKEENRVLIHNTNDELIYDSEERPKVYRWELKIECENVWNR